MDKSSGMYSKFRDEVDRFLKVGLTPQKVLIGLKQLVLTPTWIEYKKNFPTLNQIINRKKVLGRLGGLYIDTVADLQIFYYVLV